MLNDNPLPARYLFPMRIRSALWLAPCILMSILPHTSSAAPGISFVKEPKVIKASDSGRPMFEYRFAPDVAYKPYIFQLYSPAGVGLLRDAPVDHIHHHGLMFAIAVNDMPFWEEVLKNEVVGGHQIPRRTDVTDDRIIQQLDWLTPTGEFVLHETRSIQPLPSPDATLLTWRCRLETPPGKDAVTLSGHPYYGLGARLLQSMDKVSSFTNSSGQPGEIVRGDLRLVPATWVACSGPTADGKTVTIAIFDHPGNFRYPSQKFTMALPFAYIATTLNWKDPFPLKAGAPLDLCYGVSVWDGKPDAAQIDKACRQWQESTPLTSARETK